MCNNTVNNMDFHLRPIPENNSKISIKFKRLYFWSIFLIFKANSFFKKKLQLSLADPQGPLASVKFPEKPMDQFQEDLWMEGWTQGRKDGQNQVPNTFWPNCEHLTLMLFIDHSFMKVQAKTVRFCKSFIKW